MRTDERTNEGERKIIANRGFVSNRCLCVCVRALKCVAQRCVTVAAAVACSIASIIVVVVFVVVVVVCSIGFEPSNTMIAAAAAALL